MLFFCNSNLQIFDERKLEEIKDTNKFRVTYTTEFSTVLIKDLEQ